MGLTYYRLHGSPGVYHSTYIEEDIQAVLAQLVIRADEGGEGRCILDNTAGEAAALNALLAHTEALSPLASQATDAGLQLPVTTKD